MACVCMAALGWAGALAAADPAPTAKADWDAQTAAAAFGQREPIQQISLSPDGAQIAYIMPTQGQGSMVVVRGVADGSAPHMVISADGKPNRLSDCHWVSNARLVCSIYGVVNMEGRFTGFSRIFAIDADGSNIKQLSTRENAYTRGVALGGGDVIDWLPDEDGSVLMTRVYIPDDHMGSLIASKKLGLGVDKVDTRTLALQSVESAKRDAADYISDGRGTVRIMRMQGVTNSIGIMTGVDHFLYRRPGSQAWEKLSDYDFQTRDGFLPAAVDRDRNVAYGLKKVNGREALYTVALDGTLKETEVFARPDVDVEGLARIGRRRRVIGAFFQTDVPQIAYSDQEIERLAGALSKALPKQPNIDVVDSSIDERKLLVFAGSDDDPGVYYLFDRDRHDLHILTPARPKLEGHPLATMKPIQYRAADGTMIPAYLTLPAGVTNAAHLPAIVMPHGGPESRDSWGFDWLPQFYASQGYAVLQPEFRGSAGYGDAWFQQNGFRSWRTAIGDVVDAGRWLVAQGIADAGKLTIVGWSYGGYAALQSAVLAPGLYKAVVAIAPVTDLATLKAESAGWTDSALERERIGSGPEVREGSPAQHADKIKVPVLLVHGTEDANVGYGESTLMQSKLQAAGGKVRLITFKGLDHQLDDSDARRQLLGESDAFLRAATGG